MNDTAQLDLAAMLCSRLCHDLLSPVGALTNGLELLADERDPEMRQRCFELLEQSAKASADKLKFFRLAFGAAGGFGGRVHVRHGGPSGGRLPVRRTGKTILDEAADGCCPRIAVSPPLTSIRWP